MSKKSFFALILSFAFFFLLISCDSSSQTNAIKPLSKAEEIAEADKKGKETRKEIINNQVIELNQRIQSNPEIAKLIIRYNAVSLWEKEMQDLHQVFTINIQDALVRKDRRPILIFADVDDIVKENDTNQVSFEVFNDWNTVRYTLDCDVECVNKIINKYSPNNTEYAIIASISSVRKLKWTISAERLGEEDAELDFSTSRTLIANGRCLDVLKMEPKLNQ